MKYFVKAHFFCNGLEVAKGQFLDEQQFAVIGEQLQELIDKGCLECHEEDGDQVMEICCDPVPVSEEEKPKSKKKKK